MIVVFSLVCYILLKLEMDAGRPRTTDANTSWDEMHNFYRAAWNADAV